MPLLADVHVFHPNEPIIQFVPEKCKGIRHKSYSHTIISKQQRSEIKTLPMLSSAFVGIKTFPLTFGKKEE